MISYLSSRSSRACLSHPPAYSSMTSSTASPIRQISYYRPSRSLSPFFSSDSFFSPLASSSLFPRSFFDDEPFFTSSPLLLYDTNTSRKNKVRNNKSGDNKVTVTEGKENNESDKEVSGDNNNENNALSEDRGNSVSGRSGSRFDHHPLARMFSPFSMLSSLASSTSSRMPSLSVDLTSTPTAYTVHASVPGVSKEDLRITINDNVLTIEAERREEKRQGNTKKQQQQQQQQQPATSTATTSSDSSTTTSTADIKTEVIDEKNDETNNTLQANNNESKDLTDQNNDNDVEYHHVESFYGHVQRSIALPDDVNTEDLTAKYDNGVLKINIPRLQEKKQRQQQIQIQ